MPVLSKNTMSPLIMQCLVVGFFCLVLTACGAIENVPRGTPAALSAFTPPDRTKRFSDDSAIEAFDHETVKVDNYPLYDGDEIDIEVIGRPELSRVQRIGPDGRITLSVAGSIKVRNMTRDAAAEAINQALSPYFVNIFTTVKVLNYNSNHVTVMGRVQHDGDLRFDSPPHLLTVLAEVGSMPVLWKDQKVTRCAIIRGDKILWVDVARLLTGDTNLNVSLQRNDVVYIPDSNDTSVFVLGAVTKPGVYSFTPQMSFMDALGQAGGMTRDGDFNNIHLIRPNAEVNTEINMADMLTPQKNLNVAVNEGDIIYVPRHGLGQYGYIMQQINPFSTLFTITQLGATMALP